MQPTATSSPPAKASFTEKKYIPTLVFVSSLFMLWAIAITMGDVLNKHFQNVLNVSKAQSGLVQFSIFGAYAVMGIPAGLFMKHFGCMRWGPFCLCQRPMPARLASFGARCLY
jgi:FHS family L-fucose permease-like MFS transporter